VEGKEEGNEISAADRIVHALFAPAQPEEIPLNHKTTNHSRNLFFFFAGTRQGTGYTTRVVHNNMSLTCLHKVQVRDVTGLGIVRR
jgi:hypothetical protein